MRESYRLVIVGVSLITVAVLVFAPHSERTSSKEESLLAQSDAVPGLPPVRKLPVARESSPPPPSAGSRLQRAWHGDTNATAVTSEMLTLYLERNRTNAESLLTAFALTKDLAYLKSAAAAFPNDPQVQFQVITHDAFPEQRREWLEKLKQSSPDNAMADFLSARENLRGGNREQGLADLVEAVQKRDFNDFTRDKIQNLEELYLTSGKSPAEAKGLAFSNVLLPHLKELRDLGKDMAQLESQYIEAGDAVSAERMAEIGTTLGRHLSEGGGASSLLNQMIGLFIEEELLKHSSTPLPFLGQNPGDRLTEIQTHKDAIRGTARALDQWLPNASEADLITYFDRVKTFGEPNAVAWLQRQLN